MSRRGLAALAALAVAGCGTFLDGPPTNRCAADDDCAGARCDADLGMCIAGPTSSMQVAFVVVPSTDPLGGTPLPVAFDPTEVASGSEQDLVLPVNVSVRGKVRHLGEPISASIKFTLVSEIPGVASTRIDTQTFTSPMQTGDEVFDYAVQLLPGRVYDVSVQPAGDWLSALPPMRYRYEAPNGGSAHQDLLFPDEIRTIRGVIVDRAGAGQDGMLIRAVEQDTGRIVSSTCTTGSEPTRAPGSFELLVDPHAGAYFLLITPSSSRIEAGRPSPTFTVDPSALFDTGEGVTILLPPISDQVITYGGTVEPAGSPGHGTDATLTFTSNDVIDEVTGVRGTFRATAATDSTSPGAFTVQLLPGTYDVVITPTGSDLGRELGILRESGIHIGPEHATVMGHVFELPARTHYGATVQTPDARAVPNAQAFARPRASTYGDVLPDVARWARSTDALTDPDGRFDLPLDIGLYDLTIEPPAGIDWPWAIRRDVAIGGADAVVTELVELSPPVPVGGHVSFADGTPVANGEVRAYAMVDEGDATRAVQIGSAQTDDHGAYTLLLPSAF